MSYKIKAHQRIYRRHVERERENWVYSRFYCENGGGGIFARLLIRPFARLHPPTSHFSSLSLSRSFLSYFIANFLFSWLSYMFVVHIFMCHSATKMSEFQPITHHSSQIPKHQTISTISQQDTISNNNKNTTINFWIRKMLRWRHSIGNIVDEMSTS